MTLKHLRYAVSLEHLAGPLFDTMMAALNKAVHDAISKGTDLFFPASWSIDPDGENKRIGSDGMSDQNVDDPLSIYIRIGLCEYEDSEPTFTFSLRELLLPDMNDCALDGSFHFGLGRISTALRGLADEIDEARRLGEEAAKNA